MCTQSTWQLEMVDINSSLSHCKAKLTGQKGHNSDRISRHIYWFYLNIVYISNLKDLYITAALLSQLMLKDLSAFSS